MIIKNLTIGGIQIPHDIYKQAAAKLASGEGVASTIERLATQGVENAKIDGDVIVVDGIVIAGTIQGSTMEEFQKKYQGVFANTITGSINFD